jgi:hypothetical protein
MEVDLAGNDRRAHVAPIDDDGRSRLVARRFDREHLHAIEVTGARGEVRGTAAEEEPISPTDDNGNLVSRSL